MFLFTPMGQIGELDEIHKSTFDANCGQCCQFIGELT